MADTDGDGIGDGDELRLGTNPFFNEPAQVGSRFNYLYDPAGGLRQLTGIRVETIVLDRENNVLEDR